MMLFADLYSVMSFADFIFNDNVLDIQLRPKSAVGTYLPSLISAQDYRTAIPCNSFNSTFDPYLGILNVYFGYSHVKAFGPITYYYELSIILGLRTVSMLWVIEVNIIGTCYLFACISVH